MDGQARGLDNPLNWSFRVGRLFAIDLRIHVLFVLGAVLVLARSLGKNGGGIDDGVIQLALLFSLVLLHEFGHCFGCRWVGGEAREILMWPLGGLATVAPPHRWRAYLYTALAGPAVNVLLGFLSAVVLIVWTGSAMAVPWNPLHPFQPCSLEGFSHGALQWWLVYFFGLNYMLLLFNLLPVFPLDGGQVLQSLLWPKLGYHRAAMLSCGLGMVGAIALAVAGFLTDATLLYFIAVFGYVTCWQMRQQLKMIDATEAGEFGYDFSQGYTSLERSAEKPASAHPPRPGFFARRRTEKAARRRLREQQEGAEREQRLDATLAKVRQHGISALTRAERRFLEQESQRRKTAE